MHEQHERHFDHAVLTANRCGEHEHLGTGENKCRYCPSYHLSLALIVAYPPKRCTRLQLGDHSSSGADYDVFSLLSFTYSGTISYLLGSESMYAIYSGIT